MTCQNLRSSTIASFPPAARSPGDRYLRIDTSGEMSREPDDVNKLTENTYKNVMEQFNPGLRNLVTLGKNYEKAVTAMALAGRTYFDAVSKIGENATMSPVSRELDSMLTFSVGRFLPSEANQPDDVEMGSMQRMS
ncbi:hypothetical protein CRUP_016845 [Coryphaenoides rupestris]|nr:hypothetical protein CRUP_016845 [Coryphaenoides rupestris]